MKKIKITIQGTTAMLMNRFTDEAAKAATNGTRTAAVGGRLPPEDDAKQRLYTDEIGTVIMPAPNLLMCITDGGKFFKNGKSKVTTQKSSLIPACVGLSDIAYPLKSKGGWSTDTRPVRIPSTGGRILRHRPIFHDWEVSFEIELDTEIMSASLLREIVDAAGKRIGLGDFRPDRRGPFGKFLVTSWVVAGPKAKKQKAKGVVPTSI